MLVQTLKNLARRPGPRGGFTLIELLAVLVVVSIVSAIAIPAVTSITTVRAAAAQRQIVRDLTYLRERAIASGTLHRAVFSVASNNYAMYTVPGTNPASATQNAITLPNASAAWVQSLSTGEFAGASITAVSIGSGSSVTFDWSGAAYASSGSTISSDATITLAGPRRVLIRGQSYLIEAITP